MENSGLSLSHRMGSTEREACVLKLGRDGFALVGLDPANEELFAAASAEFRAFFALGSKALSPGYQDFLGKQLLTVQHTPSSADQVWRCHLFQSVALLLLHIHPPLLIFISPPSPPPDCRGACLQGTDANWS